MPITGSDLKYAGRLLLKSPWFTLLTVLVLAGGLAVSIYTFAAVNTMVYKNLPVANADAIVRIAAQRDGRTFRLNAYELAAIRPSIASLAEIGVYRTSRSQFDEEGFRRSARSTQTEWSIFEFTGTPPLMGRGFVPDDNLDGAESVAVIGYDLWRSAFLGDPNVVGRVVRMNGEATLIVGVMPEGYAFPINTEVWMPLSNSDINPVSYTQASVDAYARLRPAVSAEAAAVELSGLLEVIQRQRPNADDQSFVTADVTSLQMAQWGELGGRIFVVLNALALSVLLLACVNVGNLLLARTNERIREISVRMALGAGRSRLIVQMTLQNVVICIVGGLLALVLASRALKATNELLHSVMGSDLPFWWNWGLDASAVAAAGLLLLLTIVVVSVLPAYSVSGISPNTALKDGAQISRRKGVGRISRMLVTVQVALISVVLLTGGAAAVVAYRMTHFDWGIDPTDLFMTQGVLPGEAYEDGPEEQRVFYERLLTELRSDVQVEAALVTQQLGETEFAVDGDEYYAPGDYPRAMLVTISETPSPLITTLIEGRSFDSRDSVSALRSAIVSESLARRHWPDESALGKRIEIRGRDAAAGDRIVIGVVRDVVANPLAADEESPAIYAPLPQLAASAAATLVVRHAGSDAEARNSVYEALENAGAAVPAGRFNRYEAELEALTLLARTLTNLFLGCGVFAILLAMTGIYGLSSNAVVRRTNEIGLRRALGASNGRIVGLFLANGSRELAAGLSISALMSLALLFLISQLARLAVPLLITMGVIVVLVVSGVVLISIYVSVSRVIRHEPIAALRFE